MKTKTFIKGFLLSLLLTIGVAIVKSPHVQAFSGPGLGTAEAPFRISTCAQLQDMNSNLSAHYMLSTDIDCEFDTQNEAGALFNGGEGFEPIGDVTNPFTGSLDGRNHSIDELFIDRSTTNFVGLFGYTRNADIKNLDLTDSAITGSMFTGTLAGNMASGTVIHAAAINTTIDGSFATGGLIGYVTKNDTIADVSASWSSGTVTGRSFQLGGLVGGVDNASITNTYSKTSISRSSGVTTYIGGLIGYVGYSVLITNNYSDGYVYGDTYIGGLFGTIDDFNDTTYITGNFSRSFVEPTDSQTGGVVGVAGSFDENNMSNNYFLQDDGASATCGYNLDGDLTDKCTAITDDTYWNATATNHPFDESAWDFDIIWQANIGDRPSLQPGTLDPIGDITAPGAPVITDAIGSEETISLIWDEPTDTGLDVLDHYLVEISEAGQDSWTTHETTDTSYEFSGLDVGTFYDVRVSAFNSAGQGTADTWTNVFTVKHNVTTCQELQNINLAPDQDYSISVATIDCSETAGWNSGDGFEPIENFTGSLAGNGHEITNLTINRPNDWGQGLFNDLSDGASVSNLSLLGVSITGYGECGGLAAYINGNVGINGAVVTGTINCSDTVGGLASTMDAEGDSAINIIYSHTDVIINQSNDNYGNWWGGLGGNVSATNGGSITVLDSTANMNQDTDTGLSSIAGGAFGNVIINSNSSISINGVSTTGVLVADSSVGGMVGNYFGEWSGADEDAEPNLSFINSYSGVTVFGGEGAGGYVGSINSQGLFVNIDMSYRENPVTANSGGKAGGLVGYAHDNAYDGLISVSEVYNYGDIYSPNNGSAGGLIGLSALPVFMSDAYSHGDITGNDYTGGIGGDVIYGEIDHVYAAGAINSGSSGGGGLFGRLYTGTVSNSFAATEVDGFGKLGQAIGETYQNGSATLSNIYFDSGITSAPACYYDSEDTEYNGDCNPVNEENADPGYFLGNMDNHPFDNGDWDFVDTWGISEDNYPVLRFHPENTMIDTTPVYDITDCQELQKMKYDLSGDYTLQNDIDCYETSNWNNDKGFSPVGTVSNPFRGTLNGNHHRIDGLTINRPDTNYVGLIGYSENTDIFDLTVFGEAIVTGNDNTGLIVGRMYGGTISNVTGYEYVQGNDYTGGLVGFADCADMEHDISITHSTNDGYAVGEGTGYGGIVGRVLSGTGCQANLNNNTNWGDIVPEYEHIANNVGGIVGEVITDGGNINISSSTNYGLVQSTLFGAGGIVGIINQTSFEYFRPVMSDNVNYGYINAGDEGEAAGGLVGYAEGGTDIRKSYNTGEVRGADKIGGLVGMLNGEFDDIDIQTSLNEGDIQNNTSGSDMGGLVGWATGSDITDSYNRGSVDGISNGGSDYVGGIAGYYQGVIYNTYNSANVGGILNVGGLVGYMDNEDLEIPQLISNNFVSANAIDGGDNNSTNGVIGGMYSFTSLDNNYYYSGTDLIACAYDYDVHYEDVDCQNVNSNEQFISNSTSQPFSDGENQQWDFDAIWSVVDGDYPKLKWQHGEAVSSISNCEELQNMRFDLEADFVLAGDIDCSDTINWNGGQGFIPVGSDDDPFTGTFIGGGHIISNLFINSNQFVDNGRNAGLFGSTVNAEIVAVEIENASGYSITGEGPTGGLIGKMDGGFLSDATVNSEINADDSNAGGAVGVAYCSVEDGQMQIVNTTTYGGLHNRNHFSESGFGGVVGFVQTDGDGCETSIDNIYSEVDYSFQANGDYGGTGVGGLIGEIDAYGDSQTQITNSASAGNIYNALEYAGGAIGFVSYNGLTASNLQMSNLQATGDVTIIPENTDYNGTVGGLIGFMSSGILSGSMASGTVSGSFYVGGLVGVYNGDGLNSKIQRSYSESTVFDTDSRQGMIGGLVGRTDTGGILENNYSTANIFSDGSNVGGLSGYVMGDVISSYAAGMINKDVTGEDVGALIGWYNGSMTDSQFGVLHSFATTSLNFDHEGTPLVGGIIGLDSGPANNIGSNYFDPVNAGTNVCEWIFDSGPLEGSECSQADAAEFWGTNNFGPFELWDFDNVWNVVDNDYPKLKPYQLVPDDQVYDIATCEDLQNMQRDLNGEYQLIQDIDCSDFNYLPVGDYDIPFAGMLEGNGHEIYNIESDNQVDEYSLGGLYGSTDGSIINNFTISNCSFIGSHRAGSIVGYATNSFISNVDTSCNVRALDDNSQSTGGLLGSLHADEDNEAVLFNSAFHGWANGNNNVGGLVGDTLNAIVDDSFSAGIIYIDDAGSALGGLVGYNYDSQIYTSYSQSDVIPFSDQSNNVGGLVGVINGDGSVIADSFSASYLFPANHQGAIAGRSFTDGSVLDNVWFDQTRANLNTCINGDETVDGCMVVNTDGSEMDYFINNQDVSPLDQWNWDSDIWFTHSNNFPTHKAVIGISDCQDLQNIDEDVTADYALTKDIDCSETVNWNEGAGFSPIGTNAHMSFVGTLDGQNYSITGLYINRPETSRIGLIRDMERNSTVQNLNIEGTYIAGSRAGAVVAEAYDFTSLRSIHTDVDITVDGNTGGGIAARYSGNPDRGIYALSDLSSSGTISAANYSGGLIGDVVDANLTRVWSDVAVFVAGNTVGGLIGETRGVTVTDAYARGDVEGGQNVGGLIGVLYEDVVLQNTYATGVAVGTQKVGGLVGNSSESAITDSFAVGGATATEVPNWGNGLIGLDEDGGYNLENNFFNSSLNTYCADGEIDWVVTEECAEIDLNASPNYFKNNHSVDPLNAWNFNGTWHVNYNDYPTLSPFQSPEIVCQQLTRTSTTANVNCSTYPYGWGTTTWEMYYQQYPDGSNVSVALQDNHQAVATLTGLTPATNYRVYFRFTNDWGVSDWGYIDFTTLSENSTTTTTTTSTKRYTGSSNDGSDSKTEELKIVLNDFEEYFGDGVTLNLRKGQIIYFNVDGTEHSATVLDISADYVVLELRSTPQKVRINLGQTSDFDVTEDDINDIEITLISTSNNFATLKFRSLSNKLTHPVSQSDSGIGRVNNSLFWLFIAGGLGFIFIIILLGKRDRDNKNDNNA